MNLEGIEIFVAVVDARSFTRAGEKLRIPASTVSAKVARIEDRLGVTLIRRTTRQFRITAAGQTYYEHCLRALSELSKGEQALTLDNSEPVGTLRLTAPVNLCHALLPTLIEPFLVAYPGAHVELFATDRRPDLIAEGIDVAIWPGGLADSSYMMRVLRTSTLGLWASPAYLAANGTPREPGDLANHKFVLFGPVNEAVRLERPDGTGFDFDLPGRIVTDGFDTARTFVARGNGIGLLPDVVAEDGTAAPLARVLPGYGSSDCTIHLVYPAQRFLPKVVRAFIDMAVGAVVDDNEPGAACYVK
ncbi:LysR family transcriptional regulator [Sphingopyxis sp.]|jgi:DNA-binding transcriptional LysR family regulator|uniref:LysR family transcriptional regulator n=1 Tax=Sphingopyxis sp. TaxID=1908224 RepID=UPI003F71109D